MTTTKYDPANVEAFDFTRPGSLSSENADDWQLWVDKFAADFGERWMQLTNCEIEVRVVEQMALSFETVRQRMPRPAVGCELSIGDPELPCLLVFDRPLALGLILQMLGDLQGDIPENRPLSSIEYSLSEILFKQIADSISESWPDKEQLKYEMGQVDLHPHRSRLWDPRKMVFVCSLGFNVGDDSHRCQWILPHDELEELLQKPESERAGRIAASRQQMANRVLEISVPVTVEVGQARVPVSRLANLSRGDVLVFEQRINDPLPLVIGDRVKFYGWLGRNGNRHLFKITEVNGSAAGRKS